MASLQVELQAPNGRLITLPTGLFINNEFVAATSGKKVTSINPSDESEIVSVEAASAADVDTAVKAARAAFDSPEWNGISHTERGQLMFKLADIIEENKETLATLETWDNGKPYSVALEEDLGEVVSTLRYYAGWADKIHGQTIPTTPQKFAYTLKQPIGVCGQIIPWNYPLAMAAWKLGPALACGNTVVMKPAEQTPLSILYLASLIPKAGFPPGVVNIVNGFGREAGQALVEHPGVDKVAFTGSTVTGKAVMKSASATMKNITLETGGKSPLIVFKDADIEQATKWGHVGIMSNQGQICTATSRILVQQEIFAKFLYYFFWDELLYLSALPVTKISILLFYLRVFPRRQTQIACWVLIGFNVAFFIVWQIITIFQCKPIPGAWKVWDGEFKAKCNNINIQGWAAAAVTILLDLATLILPLPELWKLNLSFTKKVQALMMFSVGSFVTIVSVVRLQSLTTYATTQNITQDYAEVGYWSTIEVPVGIICACMPAIRSLLVRAFPRTFGTTKDQSNYANVSNQSKITSSTQKNISRVSTQQGVAVQSEWPKYQQEEQRMELADMNQKGPIRPLRPVRPASSVHTEDLDYRHYYEEDEEYFAPMPHGGHANRNNYNYNDHSNYSLPHVGRTPSRKGRTYFEDV